MSTKSSKVWLLGPPVAIMALGFAYYSRYQWARAWVDQRSPWIAEHIGSRLPPLVVVEKLPSPDAETALPPPAVTKAPEVEPLAPEPLPIPPPPSFVGPDGAVDLARLATDKAAWPKAVTLKQPKEFPAVVNGKEMGKVMVPAGAEVHMVAIQAGKLGLEYRGGGCWAAPGETDLAKRLR